MEKTLGELAALVGGELRGPVDLVIRGLASVDQATGEDITFIAHQRFAHLVKGRKLGHLLGNLLVQLGIFDGYRGLRGDGGDQRHDLRAKWTAAKTVDENQADDLA